MVKQQCFDTAKKQKVLRITSQDDTCIVRNEKGEYYRAFHSDLKPIKLVQ